MVESNAETLAVNVPLKLVFPFQPRKKKSPRQISESYRALLSSAAKGPRGRRGGTGPIFRNLADCRELPVEFVNRKWKIVGGFAL